jgi:hypothetical protein
MSRNVIYDKFTDVSEVRAASIFKVEEECYTETENFTKTLINSYRTSRRNVPYDYFLCIYELLNLKKTVEQLVIYKEAVKFSAFWDMIPCSLVHRNQCFSKTCRSHLLSKKYLGNLRSRFLQYFVKCLQTNTVLQPRRQRWKGDYLFSKPTSNV